MTQHAAMAVIGVWLAMVSVACAAGATGEPLVLVRDGRPEAQIVVVDGAPRLTRLAAQELQEHIQKISGAALPVVSQPDPQLVAIHVGVSPATRALGVSDEGLFDGAYRIARGERWLALVGRDSDFTPTEPWARNHPDQKRMLQEWDRITGGQWGNPIGGSLRRHYSKSMDLWEYDEGGSLQAVYGLLRELGVRWYMPGDLGTILPQSRDIAVTTADATVKPAVGLRYFHFAPFSFDDRDSILWKFRLGLNSSSRDLGPWNVHSHGMAEVHERPEFAAAHPDYFAIWGGQRKTDRGGKPCLSSPGLFDENVRYLRAMFDHYPDLPVGSLMPADGYGTVCECEQCRGLSTPQRGQSGSMSDYVWTYVDRVARELLKSHPDRRITCFAYGSYSKPPTQISKLSPNLIVGIVQPRRFFDNERTRQEFITLRQQWLALATPQRLVIWDHYPFTAPGRPSHGIPLYFPNRIAQDLRSLQGMTSGEVIEVMFDDKKKLSLHAPAFNHLNAYVTARLYWDPAQDLDAMLQEYYTLFYGPAAAAMKTFVDYCEGHTDGLTRDVPTMTQALTLASAAQQAAPEGSPYRQRLDELIAYLEPMKALRDQLAKGRQDVPEARINALPPGAAIVIDGKLDDEAWKQARYQYNLAELLTGERPTYGASFKALWAGDALYLAIRCEEHPGEKPLIATTTMHDTAIWNGDVVEILIETQRHSYYQLAINAAGAMVDIDRVTGLNYDWSSQAQVAAQVEDGFWTLELRIPVMDLQAGQLDPLNYIVGDKPTTWQPWYFNVCRQRVRAAGNELSAFSPTGKKSFGEVLKFAKWYVH
jgi:hypothetical protein